MHQPRNRRLRRRVGQRHLAGLHLPRDARQRTSDRRQHVPLRRPDSGATINLHTDLPPVLERLVPPAAGVAPAPAIRTVDIANLQTVAELIQAVYTVAALEDTLRDVVLTADHGRLADVQSSAAAAVDRVDRRTGDASTRIRHLRDEPCPRSKRSAPTRPVPPMSPRSRASIATGPRSSRRSTAQLRSQRWSPTPPSKSRPRRSRPVATSSASA